MVAQRTRKILLYFVLIVLAALWLIPIFSTIITSFKTSAEIMLKGFWALPSQVTLSNFYQAWSQANMNRYFLNSLIITIPSVIGALFISSLGAHALARYHFQGDNLLLFTFVGGMLIPFQILIVPVYRLESLLNIYNTYIGLIIFHISFQLGFCTFFLRNFIRTIPSEITDSARVDGCTEFGIYWRIILPLSKPALAALGTLEFTWIWNDYLWAIVLIRDDNLKPVTAGLMNLKGAYLSQWNIQTAGTLMATIPTLLVFIFLQRYFIKGLTLGAKK